MAYSGAVNELSSPQSSEKQSAGAAASPAPKRAAAVHPAYGVGMGEDCSEEERQVKRRARFSLTPGVGGGDGAPVIDDAQVGPRAAREIRT